METPASMRRITRSQVSATINNIPTSRKNEESEKKVYSRQRSVKNERSALIDVTNDSPIVGLAGGSLETPSSLAKRRDRSKKTPGSGEALLRGQVKTLLQKVEEEAEFSKLSFDPRPFLHLSGPLGSPSGLSAPTPANTPQVSNLSCGGDGKNILNGSASESPSSIVHGESKIPQVVKDIDETKQDSPLESDMNAMIRSLLLDFSEKSEVSDSSECSSALTYQEESYSREKSVEEDDASIWSIQVNASSKDEDEDGEVILEGEEAERDHYYYKEEDEDEDEDEYEVEEEGEADQLFDQMCEGLSNLSVQEKRMLPQFKGKHTRFVYNSEDEIEEEVSESVTAVSPGVLRLKGMPTPEGKHLRFPQEEDH